MPKVIEVKLNDGLNRIPVGELLSIKETSEGVSAFVLIGSKEDNKGVLEIMSYATATEMSSKFLESFTYYDTLVLTDYLTLHYFYRVYDESQESLFDLVKMVS